MIVELQERIASMLAHGESIDAIDEQVITPAPLTDEQKAALWLYAWSFAGRSEQRRLATETLAALS